MDEQNEVNESVENVNKPISEEDFRMTLAKELADKPEVYHTVVNFMETQNKQVKSTLEQFEAIAKSAQAVADRVTTLESELDQSRKFASTLMAKIPFDTFAPAPVINKVDPMEQFKADLAKLKQTQGEWVGI